LVTIGNDLPLAMRDSPAYLAGMPPAATLTADDLLHLHIPDKRVELVRGVLVVREPAGLRHGEVVMELARRLANHVRAASLGRVYAAETGFTLTRGPDTVRAPDIAFIHRARVPDPPPPGFPELAPDLAVEVLSPGDRPGEVLAKVADWLSAGTRLVWVVDPARRSARVYRGDGTESSAELDGALDGEDVVPGFACRLSEVL
jgi:Uma2 family endonuclease